MVVVLLFEQVQQYSLHVKFEQLFHLFFIAIMVMEGHEMKNGWPLGLQIINLRLGENRVVAAEPSSQLLPSISFSSISSSNLETESTASFFQDHSVTLGRLIGMKAGEGRRKFSFPHSISFDNIEEKNHNRRTIIIRSDLHQDDKGSNNVTAARPNGEDMSHGLCIPLLAGVLEKMTSKRRVADGRADRGLEV